MSTLRLLIAIVQPSLLVLASMWWLQSAELAMVVYVFVACGLMPWLLVGARPLSPRGGLPFLPRRRPDEPRFRNSILTWLVFGPCMVLGFWALRPWMGDAEAYRAALASLGWNDDHFVFYVVLFVVFVPLAEEWWWRGQALPRLCQRFGPRAGVVLAGVGFASYHVVVLVRLYDPLAVAIRMFFITGAGLYWSWLAHRQQRWGMAYIGHQAADTSIVTIFQLFFRA